MKKFIKDNRGATTIEFAMIAMPMFLLIMGGIEMGVLFFQKSRAEGVLQQAARMSITGDTTLIGTEGEKIDEYVKKQLVFTGTENVVIEKRFYDKFSQIGKPERLLGGISTAPFCFIDQNNNKQWDQDPSRTGIGGAEDIINYKVIVTYDTLFPLITNVVTNKDKMTVEAMTTLRNEPFAGNVDLREQTCCVSAAPGNPVTCEEN